MAFKPILGQHWLIDKNILQSIVLKADLKQGETVLEIGTGLGYLTDQLIKTKALVTSLEYDQKLYDKALKKYDLNKITNLNLVLGDIRSYNWSLLAKNYKICANIPYYLSAYLLRLLTEIENKPALAVLLLDQQVALKLAAQQNRSLLAVLVQSYYQVQLDLIVSPQSFQPPPKVISQVVILRFQPIFSALTLRQWPSLVKLFKISFAMPRKQLGNNLKVGFKINDHQLAKIFIGLNFSHQVRAQTLTQQDWWQLFLNCQKYL